MKKVLIVFIIVSVLILSACQPDSIDSSDETTISEISVIEISEASNEEGRSIIGLSYYVSKDKWYYLSDESYVQSYHSWYSMDTILYVHYCTEIDGVLINEDTVLDEQVNAIRYAEGVTGFEVEESTFQGYPCVYMRYYYDYVQEIDSSYIDRHFNNYELLFVANGGLYTITLASTDEVDFYMEDFNEVIESIVITPI